MFKCWNDVNQSSSCLASIECFELTYVTKLAPFSVLDENVLLMNREIVNPYHGSI